MKSQDDVDIHVPVEVQEDLREVSRRYGIRKLILFGSRARREELPKSDIDLAVKGCEDFPEFVYDVENHTRTLLKFDIINLDESISEKLLEQIRRDGIILYQDIQ